MNAPVTVNIDVPDDYAYADFDYTSTYDGPTSWSDEVYGYDEWSGTYSHTFLVCPSSTTPVPTWGTSTSRSTTTTVTRSPRPTPTTPSRSGPTAPRWSTTPRRSAPAWSAPGLTAGRLKASTKYDNDAWVGHRVNLQQKRSGSWHTVKSAWTNSSGRANLSVTPAAGAAKPYRAVSTGNTHVSTKVSQTYWLNRR